MSVPEREWDSWEDADVPVFPGHAPSPVYPRTGSSTDQYLREAHPYFASQPTIRILSRKDAQPQHSATIDSPGPAKEQEKSLAAREKEYQEAKIRLGLVSDKPSPSIKKASPSGPPRGGGGPGHPARPDGSSGFKRGGRGRGKARGK
eukprot:TRINITY_DN339_c0_g2_i5.p1 TRINITY_DN339_c0_g2~~TRINITY_DN339_c0_g2_i5.p1  ORF type:complete len:147 (-),score=23.74 TRINITY_DN339_c0_g2_i5:34-474(-)